MSKPDDYFGDFEVEVTDHIVMTWTDGTDAQVYDFQGVEDAIGLRDLLDLAIWEMEHRERT